MLTAADFGRKLAAIASGAADDASEHLRKGKERPEAIIKRIGGENASELGRSLAARRTYKKKLSVPFIKPKVEPKMLQGKLFNFK